LHGSQTEIRNVFTVIIQKLPKVNEQPIADSVAGKSFLRLKTSSMI
jgi:hypothetical protein